MLSLLRGSIFNLIHVLRKVIFGSQNYGSEK